MGIICLCQAQGPIREEAIMESRKEGNAHGPAHSHVSHYLISVSTAESLTIQNMYLYFLGDGVGGAARIPTYNSKTYSCRPACKLPEFFFLCVCTRHDVGAGFPVSEV